MKTIQFSKKGSTNAQYEFPNKCSYTHLHLRIKQETSAQPQHKERKQDSIFVKKLRFFRIASKSFHDRYYFPFTLRQEIINLLTQASIERQQKNQTQLPVIRYVWLSCFCLSRSHHRTQQIDRLRNKGDKPSNSLRWPIYVFNTVDII